MARTRIIAYSERDEPDGFADRQVSAVFLLQGGRQNARPAVSADGEAKFWIEPIISLANYTGFNKRQLTHLHKLVEEHRSEIVKAWKDYFRV